jgi:hypothetical protein
MSIKFLFLVIWVFFIFKISSYINLDKNIFQFDFKNWFGFFQDILSIFILIGLSIYLLYRTLNKKIHISIILIIYPICGLIGYFVNGTKNFHQDFILWHHFITLSSAFLFFAAIQSNKVFDYKFKELLLKIFIAFIFAFFLLAILPNITTKIFSNIDIRSSYELTISVLDKDLNIKQNINGSSRIMVILLLTFLMLFKKLILKKKILAYVFFLISLLIFTTIYLLQSRFNILASLLIIFFLFLSIKNINLIKKLIYFLIFFIIPIVIFNSLQKDSRFSEVIYYDNHYNYSTPIELCKIIQNLEEKEYFEINELRSSLNFLCLTGTFETFDEFHKFQMAVEKFKNSNKNLFDPKLKEDYENVIFFLDITYRSYGNSMRNICTPKLSYLDGLSTGRICAWEMLLNNIKKKDLLFGRGFFADQFYLHPSQKVSSNSWINILYNAGIVSVFLCLIFFTLSFLKFFRIKNINHKNSFVSISHYLLLYFIFRSTVEDTLAFVSIDFLCFFICFLIIKENVEKKFYK